MNAMRTIMKAIQCWCVILIAILTPGLLLAQVSPYSLSPDWFFGYGGRLTFPNGNFPSSGPPLASTVPTNVGVFGVEASTSVCFTDGSTAMYTNTMTAYNGNHAANTAWTSYIRDFRTAGTDNVCAGSSTGGAVNFPDPASPANAFYLILGSDLTGGICGSKGLNRYRFTGTGVSVAYNAGPVNIEGNTFPAEAIAAGSDGDGGYWVVAHARTTTNTFRVWHYTSGGITGPVDYSGGAAVSDVSSAQSYLKFSPCMDMIAYHSGGTLVINNFNRTTGVVGAEIRRISPVTHGAGLEFSKDGSRVFHSGQGTIVSYVDIASGTTGTVTGSSSWSMQLGPDGNIYTSQTTGSTAVGVISNTPVGSTPSYSTLAIPGGASLYRGLNNISLLNPELPVISNSTACPTVDFSYDFENYFNQDITIVPGSEEWDWGTGTFVAGLGATPSHTFPGAGTYNIRIRVEDAHCGQLWIGTKSITLSCPAPVDLLLFTGKYQNGQTELNWTTATELDNDYFVVERSEDGVNFYPVGKVDGIGNTSTISSYSLIDPKDCFGVTYYRLVQYDLDGTKTYSNVIHVQNNHSSVSVSPNPFTDNFVVSFAGSKNSEIKVLDVLGRTLETKTMMEETYTISMGEALSAGTYIVMVITEDRNYTSRLVKE
jgi:hypothetical protein